jgi:uncharacterized protein (TIGR03435 family)
MRLPGLTAAALAAAWAVHAHPADQPAFDVASVKPSGGIVGPDGVHRDVFSTRPVLSPGRIRWTTQLCYLIGYGYHLDLSRISGAKCGMIYSIEATFDAQASDEQMRLMIQSLLAARLKLRAHRASTPANGYALLGGKGGPKLKAAAADEGEGYVSATIPQAGMFEITGRGASMSQLGAALERVVSAPVWDKTGLSGKFDFQFRCAQFPDPGPLSDAPSLPTALQENLGLKLE